MKTPEDNSHCPQSQFGRDPMSVGLNVLAETRNYNRWIYDLIEPYLGNRIVEVGSGIGNITGFLTDSRKLDCIEPYQPYFEILQRKFGDAANIALHSKTIEEITDTDIPPAQADAAICLNVLEHIEDDIAAVQAMTNLLAPGGRVVLVLPAMAVLYGSIDKNIGHYRRYTKKSVAKLFAALGLETVENRYYNMLGCLGWFVNARILDHQALSHKSSLMFDRLVPTLRKIEKHIKPPFGLSILAVGKKV